MDTYPQMDILFPAAKEADLLGIMQERASVPWSWQRGDPFGRPPEDGNFYFHRDARQSDPPCTLCIARTSPGKLVVRNIVPDANTVHEIARERYVAVLREFDEQIACPAAELLKGMTMIGTAKQTLEDHFSVEAVRLLERFCTSANAGDGGSHPGDQDKWIAFLQQIHREESSVHCDTFGKCLLAKNWWPADAIPKLVREYDFATRLLRTYDRV